MVKKVAFKLHFNHSMRAKPNYSPYFCLKNRRLIWMVLATCVLSCLNSWSRSTVNNDNYYLKLNRQEISHKLDQDIYNYYDKSVQESPYTHLPDQIEGRKVANFLPDEELIVVPYREEKGYVERIHEKHSRDLDVMKTRVRDWIMTDEFAQNHGLTNLPVYQTATPKQRRNFFERRYLRFFTRDLEQTTNQGIQEWWESWSVDDEIESIEVISERKPFLLSEQGKSGDVNNLASKKEVEITSTKSRKKRKKFKIGTQPRIEQGAFLITMSSFIVDGRVFLAANGKHEVTFQRKFKSIKTRALVNYYVDERRMLASIDKKLNRQWSIRLSHDKRNMSLPSENQDDRIQLNYRIGF